MTRTRVTGLLVAALAALWATTALPVVAAADETLDAAFSAYWAAETDQDLVSAVDAILATNAPVEQVRAKLRAGRTYSDDVATGRQLLSRQNRNGVEHAYVLHVPESYDPAAPHPVRVYLHGGVMRPLRTDGEWWPNDARLAREDALVVFPVSWPDSIWWQRSQAENLSGLLNDLKRVYNVDENRVHLLGISDGATGAYYHAFKATTPWAGFLPFNGHPVVLANPATGVDSDLHVTNLRNKPFFVVNGANDRLYPAASVERFMRLFLDAGIFVNFRPQADAGHDVRWWGRETPHIDAFVRDTRRQPLPDELTWETDNVEAFNRAHWLVINELGAVDGESELKPFNTLGSSVERAPLGINMVGELQNRPGLMILEVGQESIASRAGMMADDIIIEVDGIPTPDVGAFTDAIVGFSPGQRLPIRIERAGVQLVLTLNYPVDPSGGSRPVFPRRRPSGRVDLTRQGNTVTASTQGASRFTLLLSPEQFDFAQPIRVVTNGVVSHDGVVTPDAATLLRWAAIDQDRSLLFSAELQIEVEPRRR